MKLGMILFSAVCRAQVQKNYMEKISGFSMDSILQILQGLGKSYFNVKGGSSPAIQVCTICPSRLFPAHFVPLAFV